MHTQHTMTLHHSTVTRIARGEGVKAVRVVGERAAGPMTFEVNGQRIPHAALWYAMKQVDGDFRRLQINADLSIDILNRPVRA